MKSHFVTKFIIKCYHLWCKIHYKTRDWQICTETEWRVVMSFHWHWRWLLAPVNRRSTLQGPIIFVRITVTKSTWRIFIGNSPALGIHGMHAIETTPVTLSLSLTVLSLSKQAPSLSPIPPSLNCEILEFELGNARYLFGLPFIASRDPPFEPLTRWSGFGQNNDWSNGELSQWRALEPPQRRREQRGGAFCAAAPHQGVSHWEQSHQIGARWSPGRSEEGNRPRRLALAGKFRSIYCSFLFCKFRNNFVLIITSKRRKKKGTILYRARDNFWIIWTEMIVGIHTFLFPCFCRSYFCYLLSLFSFNDILIFLTKDRKSI